MEKRKRGCVVPTCKGERFDLVHKFPMDKERAEQWRNSLMIPELYKYSLQQIQKRFHICSRHFRVQDYKNVESRFLNKTAIPSINLKVLDNLDIIDRNFKKDIGIESSNFPMIVNKSESITNYNQTSATVETTTDSSKPEKRIKIDNILAAIQKSENLLCHPNQSSSSIVNLSFPTSAEQQHYRNHNRQPTKIEPSNLVAVVPLPESNQKNLMFYHLNKKKQQLNLDQYLDFFDNLSSKNEDQSRKQLQITDRFLHDDELLQPFTKINSTNSYSVGNGSNSTPLMTKDYIEIPGRDLKLNYVWLRDHCRCSKCFNHGTSQRIISILDIPMDITASSVSILDDKIIVKWSDDHESDYSWKFLDNNKLENYKKALLEQMPITWTKNEILKSNYARVTLNDYLCEDKIAKQVVRSLIDYGFAIIDKVPPNIVSTEIAVRRLFPIHKTFFGEMWTLGETSLHRDMAYTKEALDAHTDNSFCSDTAGLQILHCTNHTGTGGETLLVDGFKAVEMFKNKHPEAYSRLCKTQVPAEYIEDGMHHFCMAPILKENSITGYIEQIRWNLSDRSVFNTLPHDEIAQFYSDIKLLGKEIRSAENQWWFKLNPGTVLIFDNWRVLHGRSAYAGLRIINGCYVSRTEFLSVARIMGIIK